MTVRSILDYANFITKKLQHVKKYPMLVSLVSHQLHHNKTPSTNLYKQKK